MKTALLTAVGSASAGIVIERLHALGYRVAGCDIYPQAWNVASGEVDVFFQAVRASEADAYVRQMEEAVRRERADVLIPLTDVEVDALCARKERFAALGCTLCVPDEPCARLCRDKQAMAALLAREGACRVIPTRSPLRLGAGGGGLSPDAQAPARPQQPGAGHRPDAAGVSRGAGRARGLHRPAPICRAISTPWMWPATVSANVQALVRHELLRTSNGLGTAVRVLPGHPLEAVCARVAACAGVVGVVNMEFIVDGDAAWFLEVNPRFSGGVGLQRAGGRGFSRAQPALPRRRGHRSPRRGAGNDAGAQGLPRHNRKINFSP